MPPAAEKMAPLPSLNYGVWTLKGAFDVGAEKHVLDDSTLKFTSQSKTAGGLLLEGTAVGARERAPERAVYHYHVGVAQLKVGEPGRARTALLKALSIDATVSAAADAQKPLATISDGR